MPHCINTAKRFVLKVAEARPVEATYKYLSQSRGPMAGSSELQRSMVFSKSGRISLVPGHGKKETAS
jgi:hypothetical protein